MKKIITNGILVITLISSSYLFKVEFVDTADLSHKQTISLSDEYVLDLPSNIQSFDIDNRIADIRFNQQKINALLKGLKKMNESIQSHMFLYAENETRLSKEQMTVYKDYSDFYSYGLERMDRLLCNIKNSEKLKKAQDEIMQVNFNLDIVDNELEVFYNYQLDILDTFNSIIEKSEMTLATI